MFKTHSKSFNVDIIMISNQYDSRDILFLFSRVNVFLAEFACVGNVKVGGSTSRIGFYWHRYVAQSVMQWIGSE